MARDRDDATAKRIERDHPDVDFDLGRLTGDSPSKIDQAGHRLAWLGGRAVEHYVLVSSLLTLVAGGFYGLAYTRFYRALDVTPEQAGLSTANIVTQSVLGGVALFALITVAIFLVMFPLAHLEERDPSRPEGRGSWEQFAGHMIMTGSAIVLLLWLADKTEVGLVFGAFLSAITVFLALITGLRFGWRKYWPTATPRPLEPRWESYVVYMVAIAIPVGLLGTGYATITEAARYGAEAAEGNAVRSPDILGIPFLGVRAEPALVTWKEGRPPTIDTPRCAFYVGASNGETLLYDHRTGTTSEVPSADVVLALHRSRTSCEAPVSIRPPTVRRLAVGRYRCSHGGWQSHSHPTYSYRWTTDGFPIPSRSGGESPVLQTEGTGWVVHCHVTATTPRGADAAVSRGVLVTAGLSSHPGPKPGQDSR